MFFCFVFTLPIRSVFFKRNCLSANEENYNDCCVLMNYYSKSANKFFDHVIASQLKTNIFCTAEKTLFNWFFSSNFIIKTRDLIKFISLISLNTLCRCAISTHFFPTKWIYEFTRFSLIKGKMNYFNFFALPNTQKTRKNLKKPAKVHNNMSPSYYY